jgi:hypothetical protein
MVEARRLKIAGEEKPSERVRELHFRQVCGHRPGQQSGQNTDPHRATLDTLVHEAEPKMIRLAHGGRRPKVATS